MPDYCPQCRSYHLVRQDFEELTDTVGVLKLSHRLQIRCDGCGWISFEELPDSDQADNP